MPRAEGRKQKPARLRPQSRAPSRRSIKRAAYLFRKPWELLSTRLGRAARVRLDLETALIDFLFTRSVFMGLHSLYRLSRTSTQSKIESGVKLNREQEKRAKTNLIV